MQRFLFSTAYFAVLSLSSIAADCDKPISPKVHGEFGWPPYENLSSREAEAPIAPRNYGEVDWLTRTYGSRNSESGPSQLGADQRDAAPLPLTPLIAGDFEWPSRTYGGATLDELPPFMEFGGPGVDHRFVHASDYAHLLPENACPTQVAKGSLRTDSETEPESENQD